MCPCAEAPPARIRAMVFFASLDQRSAGGDGACTLCCVVRPGSYCSPRHLTLVESSFIESNGILRCAI